MKKTIVALLIAVVAVASFAGVGTVYAKGPNNQGANNQASTNGEGTTFGNGMQGPRGANGAAAGQVIRQGVRGEALGIGDEILHDGIIAFFADALDIDVTILETRLDAGETMADIAIAEGLTVEEYRALMLDAREAAITQAVADGLLTQEQADLMNQGGFGGKGGGVDRGTRGTGLGQFANADCPL